MCASSTGSRSSALFGTRVGVPRRTVVWAGYPDLVSDPGFSHIRQSGALRWTGALWCLRCLA